jgi:hypothetical protein
LARRQHVNKQSIPIATVCPTTVSPRIAGRWHKSVATLSM